MRIGGIIIVTNRETIINKIAELEDSDAASIKMVFDDLEEIIYDCLSSTTPTEKQQINLFNGIKLIGEYKEGKQIYNINLKKNTKARDSIVVKANFSKTFKNRINGRY